MIFIVLICTMTLSEISPLSHRSSFLANSALEQRLPSLVIWCHSDPGIITDFLTEYHGLVTAVNIKSSINISEIYETTGFKQVVVFANNPEEYKYILRNVSQAIIQPIRILLVITEPVKEMNILEKYTKISFENDASEIVIISSDSDEGNVTLSTYTPYGPAGCGNYMPVILKSDTNNLYPQKFTNFYGCPIKVIMAYTFPYIHSINDNNDIIRGIDVDLLNLVLEHLNFSIIKYLTDISGNKAFEFVVNGTFDMTLPSIILSHKRYLRAQATHVFKTLDIVLCAPNQREIYAWAKVLLPLFTNTTPLIIISFLLFMGSVALIQFFGRYRRNSPKGIIFGTLALFLGQEINFETKYWLNNGVFMLWIWYCTVVRIAYQGDLVHGLQKTFLEPHLQTVDQAIKVVDEYGGPEGLLQMFRNSSIDKKLKVLPWKDIPVYIKDISKGRRFLLITDFSLIRHSSYEVQIVDERLSSLPQTFFMRARWSAAKEVNRVMVQLFEAGFVTKIIREYNIDTQRDGSTGGFDPLAMTTLASCFLGLAILSFLWLIVLCAEIVWYTFVMKKKKPSVS